MNALPAPLTTGPEITRSDAQATYVSYWFVDGADHGRAVLDQVVTAWEQTPWPEGLLSLSCYLATDGSTVLTYAQCAGPDVHGPFLRGLPAGPARVEPIAFRLHRSVVVDPAAGAPGTLVAASFDVDGAERQRHIVETVARTLEQAPTGGQAGLIAAHFHLSVDGSRVLNFAEWTSDEAHAAFLDGATRHRSLRLAQDTPGVRPIGYKRYRLHRSLGVGSA
ncbi:antibiotic biosynthesis monooxygenase [Streptomyces sp. ISL-11]|uniref:antibiotic biosynthesis monooxygenase n=1 Tax=Streptomyces sp. ISL-11 TaxID=2819174 RepID=UPI001BED1A09|nr:antibiotic biosynthesis monooxygenase [Streptomyces sp. ISL-11]MBT2386700.1 antibiotic biosynthesis monooxygenase [Streptomyces sp. ISL-11]